MLKWIAICSNTILLLTVLIMFTKHVLSGGTVDGYDIFMFVLILVPPISSLAVLFSNLKGGEGWLGLYLKRKALEEKQKIEKLRGQENQDRPKP